SGPPELRTIASTSLADPRTTTLNGTQEFLEPLMEQIHRGAAEAERRQELVQPLLRLFSRARWNLPQTEEQQKIFYSMLIPHFPPERGQLQENTRAPLQMEKDSRDWYLARSLGNVLHANPDLHTEMLVGRMPERFATPMDEMLWLPSARWLLSFGKPLPAVADTTAGEDKYRPARERAIDLLVKQLTSQATDLRLRNTALGMLNDVQIRSHPKVSAILPEVRPNLVEREPSELAAMPAEWKRNFHYFRNWVMPEMQRANREDELGCLGCHAVPGRVPSMELAGPPDGGFMSTANAYRNYRVLLERVNESNVEESRILRKPLNVQSGQEDGHQGGRRYSPNDRGYQIIRNWALDAAALKRGR
ncbi:MAG: hypothetical protein ACRD44_03885, partial [Bryobacteraceae bacterium]